MESLNITYREICELFIDSNKDLDVVVGVIKTNHSNICASDFKQFMVKTFIPRFKIKFNNASRKKSIFLESNEDWLSRTYCVGAQAMTYSQCDTLTTRRGRPAVPFEESEPRTKRMKVQELLKTTSVELIQSAAERSKKEDSTSAGFTPEQAVSLMLDAGLSVNQYRILRSAAKGIGHDIFPHYTSVLAFKNQCYPVNVEVAENFSKVGLQELLDHTARRILETKSVEQLEVIPEKLHLISKWGCDGSSGHSEYQQNFTNEKFSDKSLFLTSLVPLKLTELDCDDEMKVCWKNTEPSSTRFCRPLKFEFIKETADTINAEVNRVNDEIYNLSHSVFEVRNKKFDVAHSLALTMIDGKIATTITGSSAMSVCYICGAKPSDMNNIDALVQRCNSTQAMQFGISPLHARIKFMECILHLAYNKEFKEWRTSQRTREQHDSSKKEIQQRLKSMLGIKVDVVKQGVGTTNDGNTSRRFFENPTITADIIGIDANLIHRFKIILATINCSSPIDVEKFNVYCMETARLYVSLYGWYYMPITVHKVLMHGSTIVSQAILPIGKFYS